MKHPQFLDVQTSDGITPQVTIYADRGYQGILDVPGTMMLTPFKKEKGQKITAEQKEYNKIHSKIRIYVEHAIRKVKKWRIMRDMYRNPLKMYDTINDIVCGLVNNRILCKNHLDQLKRHVSIDTVCNWGSLLIIWNTCPSKTR